MLIVNVYIHVKPEKIEEFIKATTENARHSIEELGIERFDVQQQEDDPHKFLLTEIYRSNSAISAHKLTDHYLLWRDSVAEMMAEPRFSVKYRNVFPNDESWEYE